MAQVNYTTYDMRQEYNIINPRQHSNIMVAASNLDGDTGISASGHPFAYAHVLGVFHTDIMRIGSGLSVLTHTIQFIFVYWYRRDTSFKAGFKACRLHHLQLLPADNADACGFLDPSDVIRRCHIIPAFAYGILDDGCNSSHLSGVPRWCYFYMNL